MADARQASADERLTGHLATLAARVELLLSAAVSGDEAPALIVADGLGRRAALVETSPRYCALILERAERRKINLITRSKDPTCVHSSPAP
jgi:hypothetical protein